MPTLALLPTCLVDQVLPEIGVATVKLLRRAGYAVDFPAGQTCCGQPFFNAGYRAEAVRLAKRTIVVFEPYETVVLPSGSCAAMIRVEYPHLLHDDPEWRARAEALDAKTFELSEFLVRFEWGALPRAADNPEGPATYHDSCHMCRLLGLREQPRRVLEMAGLAVTEMDEPDRCCGFGGTFSLKMPEVSAAMAREKLRQAAATGAGLLVTADPGCLVQMRRFADEAGVRVEHLAAVLEERTR
ncbi:MAG TPA: (Fe-S)-binding protein [Anaerolineales bacterium]|nr:(Fe-S)-binding protein [Anaerolineales bacterium]